MNILFVDDQPSRHEKFHLKVDLRHNVVSAYTHIQALHALRNYDFAEVWLDHDLQDYEYREDGSTKEWTGVDIARYIAEDLPKERRPDVVVIHSFNAPGAANMAAILKSAGLSVTIRPFGR